MSFEIKDGVLVRCKDWSEDPRITEYTIPDGVTTIGKHAFLQHLYITKITLPEGLVSIEQGAFERCAELRTINIPQSVKRIGKHAFSNCPNLRRYSVKFPEDVEFCGDPFETSAEEKEALDEILFKQRDNPLLYNRK